ncbi:conserved hypothetical protein [Ricinus communis]|uniref:Uncharacterized protein n=1 Tax=Ricinus communis TaxID=3988 RepID=B9SJE3_RICCO|nr:conserved hypothetical protein [Ricinus communis]
MEENKKLADDVVEEKEPEKAIDSLSFKKGIDHIELTGITITTNLGSMTCKSLQRMIKKRWHHYVG